MHRAFVFAFVLAACQKGSAPPAAGGSGSAAPVDDTEHVAYVPHGKVELVEEQPAADLPAAIAAEVARAEQANMRPVVYVGATWCEPCRYFHDAAVSGALDARFGGTRFLAYDVDRDGAQLDAAGYESQLIPLFAIPGADGKASGLKIQGSIKGDKAVDQISPRLEHLLEVPTK
ncbi:MAG TPA: hypothetical protein VGM88_31255 [Kofleriaceae bacterium]